MNVRKVMDNNFKLLKYVIRFAPELFVWRALLAGMSVVLNIIVGVGFIKFLTDAIQYKYGFKKVVFYIMIIGFVYLINSILNSLFNYYYNYLGKTKIHQGMHEMIFEKVRYVDLEMYDNTDFYNNYIWALNEVDNRTIASFENLIKFVQAMASLSGIIALASIWDFGIVLFGIVPMAITLFISNIISYIGYDYQKTVNPIERKKEYTKRVFYQFQYAKELKMYSIGNILINRFKNCISNCVEIYKKYAKKLVLLSFLQDASGTIIGTVSFSTYLAFKAIVLQTITVGTVAASFNAVSILNSSLGNLFAVYPKLKENALFAEKIFVVLNYKSNIEKRDGQILPEETKVLEFKDVCFKYSEDKEYVLKNINMKICEGEKIAIVGLNGAGKTTLIKLLLNYYNPTEGCIEYNGIDIRKFSTKEYRKKFSTIFQDYQLYAVSLIENIIMRPVSEKDAEHARECLEKSCMKEYEDKLRKEVTKEFEKDGLVFSGGQTQKVAIARAMAQKGEILIMDEASSALDPISENEINKTVMKNNENKTIVIISHRLSTIAFVEKIYYMEGGMIIEEGTHKQLMKLNEKYAEMYKAQAEKYKDIDN